MTSSLWHSQILPHRCSKKKQEEVGGKWTPPSAGCSSFKLSQWYPSISLAHNILFKQCFSCEVTEHLILFLVWCANWEENVRLWMKEISKANLSTASEIKRDYHMTKLQQMLLFLFLFLFSTRVFYSIILSSSPFGHGLVLNSEAKGFLVVCG